MTDYITDVFIMLGVLLLILAVGAFVMMPPVIYVWFTYHPRRTNWWFVGMIFFTFVWITATTTAVIRLMERYGL